MEDVLETSTSPLIHQNDAMRRNKKTNFLLATFPAISAIFLLASFATAPLQMLTLFNSCPSLRSSPLANITCDDSTTSPVVGTVCKVTCPVGYPSTGQLESTCSWTGRWTNDNLDCDATPGLVIIGKSWSTEKSFAEVYFHASIINQTIDQFPYILHGGMSAYVDGKLLACGGYDGANIRSSCYQLNRDGSWDAAPSMPQEREFASSAVIDQGSSLWILGGMDSSYNFYSSTIVWKSSSSSWVEGPSLTSPRAFHCSVTLPNQDVLVIGGFGNVDLSLVERYSSGQWSTEAPLHQARADHSCSHVWMADWGEISPDAHTGLSGVVVAGGAIQDSPGVFHPVSSVELLYKGVWRQLPQLPVIHKPNLRMNLPTSLVWLPIHGLKLVGGCWVNYDDSITWCTPKLWSLRSKGWAPNITYHWVIAPLEKLKMAVFRGNGEVVIPSTYFN